MTISVDGDLVGVDIGQLELATHLTAVRVGVGADAQLAGRIKAVTSGRTWPRA